MADVPPLDVTGVTTVTVGTLLWALGFLVLLPFAGRLGDDGRLWWLWTCVTGAGMGIFGRWYCRRRERRLRLLAEEEASPLGAAGG